MDRDRRSNAVWDRRFLALARHVAGWSKDPSTKVGAVIVRPDRTVASMGYNGFPRGTQDTAERLADRGVKLELTVHAEINALAFAQEPLRLCTLYVWPLPPCIRCATSIIQHNLVRVVAPEPEIHSQWWVSNFQARDLLVEARVQVDWIPHRSWSVGDDE